MEMSNSDIMRLSSCISGWLAHAFINNINTEKMSPTLFYYHYKQTEEVYCCETEQTYIGPHGKAHPVKDNNINTVTENSRDRYGPDNVYEIQ